MNATRMILFVLGLGLVIVGAWLLFVQTGLDRWVPIGIAVAGLLVLIGLLIVGFSEKAHDDGPTREVREVEHHHGHH